MYSERIPRGLATGFFFDLNVGSFYFEFKDTFLHKAKKILHMKLESLLYVLLNISYCFFQFFLRNALNCIH
jgi:hypothetical protein